MKTKTIIAISILILFVLIISDAYAAAENEHAGKAQRVIAKNGKIKIPDREVKDGKAHFYYITLDSTKIVFFLLMSNDEVIQAAFDACKSGTCGSPRSRYSQDDDYMVCFYCGERVHERDINTSKGSCPPAPLDQTNDADYITITLDDLEQGRLLFVE
jgi:uncharacterized membrane protein